MNTPDSARYTFETIGNTYWFVFPYRKEWWLIVTYGASAAGYFTISLLISVSLLSDGGFEQLFGAQLMWLFGIVLVFLVALTLLELLWQLVGKEVVEIADDALVIKHHIFGLGLSKRFPVEKVNGLQVSTDNTWASAWYIGRRDYRFFNFKRGRVALNSGKSLLGQPVTYRFGTILDEVEAGQVVALILNRFPQFKAKVVPHP